jgi:hypothetical protein
MNPTTSTLSPREKMRTIKRLATTTVLAVAILLVAVTSTTPHVYGAATPCGVTTPKCSIAILSPGSGAILNKGQTVNSSFLVSFLVNNFTLVQPGRGTPFDVNTTTTAAGAGNPTHNEGHLHVFVDNVYVTIWTSTNGIPLTLVPGAHTIRLDLVNDFHQEFSPGINATTTVNVVDPLHSAANSAQSNAGNAMYYSLGALVASVVSVILVAYVAFKPKPKP